MFSSGKSRLAPSTANALLGKRENSLGDLDQFLKEEVEAAQMMYDAFRAIKSADGSVIDTRGWSEGTAIRVKVRSPATRPPPIPPNRPRTAGFPGLSALLLPMLTDVPTRLRLLRKSSRTRAPRLRTPKTRPGARPSSSTPSATSTSSPWTAWWIT